MYDWARTIATRPVPNRRKKKEDRAGPPGFENRLLGLLRKQVADQDLFFGELCFGGLDLFPAEVVDF